MANNKLSADSNADFRRDNIIESSVKSSIESKIDSKFKKEKTSNFITFKQKSNKEKIVIICICVAVGVAFIACFMYEKKWILSLFTGFISYIIMIFCTFKSIKEKIDSKILEAKKQDLTENGACEDSKDSISESKNAKDSKKILKFLDLSKVSLGFEMSVSMPRIVGFLLMILGFMILIFTHNFYALVYIGGVFLGSIASILFLFFRES